MHCLASFDWLLAKMALRSAHLFSAILQLSQKAIQEIRQVESSGVLNMINKGTADTLDPCTEADTRSQGIIMSNLLRLFPSLQIIGEEHLEPDSSLLVSNLVLDLIPESLIPEGLREVSIDTLNVWVDPLDGTVEFINGNLAAVTSLIGVAMNGRPIFGAVGLVFADPPVIYWGGPGIGIFRALAEGTINIEAYELPPPQEHFIIGSTKSHEDEKLINFIQTLESETILKIGGCGCKAVKVLLGEIAAHVFPKGSAKKWDGCAVEALLTATPEGKLTKMTGELYDYRIEASHMLKEGILSTRNPALHEYIARKFMTSSYRTPKQAKP